MWGRIGGIKNTNLSNFHFRAYYVTENDYSIDYSTVEHLTLSLQQALVEKNLQHFELESFFILGN